MIMKPNAAYFAGALILSLPLSLSLSLTVLILSPPFFHFMNNAGKTSSLSVWKNTRLSVVDQIRYTK